MAGLPPTTSNINGAGKKTTFDFLFPNFIGTTTGTSTSINQVLLGSGVSGQLPVANGGTGSTTRNFVDLTSNETVAGIKTFSSNIVGSITGNASTVTTNANLTGDVTSIGNATTYSGTVPVNKGGTGSTTQNFVDLTTNQTIAGTKTLSSDAIINGVTIGIGTGSVNSNTLVGNNSLTANTSGGNNTVVGVAALKTQQQSYRNTAIGYGSMAYGDAFAGVWAVDNTSIGYLTGANISSGANNTAVGSQALYNTTKGSNNLALGTSSLTNNIEGQGNVGIGYGSLATSKNRSYSTAIGYQSMYYSENSLTFQDSNNTAVGAYSLMGSTTPANNTGRFNTALGTLALTANTSGTFNTGIGYNAGSAITTGGKNVVIGSNTGSTIATTSNNIIISDGDGNIRQQINSTGNTTFGGTLTASEIISGTTPIGLASGGTGVSYPSNIAMFNGISPLTTAGDLLTWTGSGSTNTRIPVGTESKILAVSGGMPSWVEEDSSNFLINPGFENSTIVASCVSGWTCTNGIGSSTTVSGEFIGGLSAMKVSTTASVLNVSQSVTTPSGSPLQYVVGAYYASPLSDFQVCTTINGAEKTCVPSANLILDGLYHPIEIPEVSTPGQTIGIKFKAGSSTNAYALLVDKAYIKQGLGTQALQLDTVYSANSSSAGVVSNLNKTGWIGNCSITSTAIYTCPLTGFTIAPNCTVNVALDNAQLQIASGVVTTSTSLKYVVSQTNIANPFLIAEPVSIICQKSGNDYLASSAAVYSQASANYDWTTFTPTITGIGSPTLTNACKHRRLGGDLEVSCQFATGTTTGTPVATFTLPSSLSLDSSRIVATNTISASGQSVGIFQQAATSNLGAIVTATGTSTTLVYFGLSSSGTAGQQFIPQFGNVVFNNSSTTNIYFKVPISGWSNSASIVGSFAGYTNVPGYQGNVDTFSVSYGATINTNCTTISSVCAFNDTIGLSASVNHGATTGIYSLTAPRPYSKLKCTVSSASTSQSSTGVIGTGSALSCASCSTLTFVTGAVGTGAVDTYGTISCLGTY